MTALLGLDVGRPDHFAPLFGFLLKPPPVIRGRAAGDAAAQVGKPLLFRLSMISGVECTPWGGQVEKARIG